MSDRYDNMGLRDLQDEARARGLSISGRNPTQLRNDLRQADQASGASPQAQPTQQNETERLMTALAQMSETVRSVVDRVDDLEEDVQELKQRESTPSRSLWDWLFSRPGE